LSLNQFFFNVLFWHSKTYFDLKTTAKMITNCEKIKNFSSKII